MLFCKEEKKFQFRNNNKFEKNLFYEKTETAKKNNLTHVCASTPEFFLYCHGTELRTQNSREKIDNEET